MTLLPKLLLELQGSTLLTWTLTTAERGTDRSCDECNDHTTLYYSRPVMGQQDVGVCIDCIHTAIQGGVSQFFVEVER